ncbi:uncharacterized protein Pbp49 isoform X1 [Maniola hyperantus]|uniref:uncharacterized protein Pbp49 isoform X1 n=2 Tax=Aphantopus hyperantus TaxID=2795564 RepID=UPI00374A043A
MNAAATNIVMDTTVALMGIKCDNEGAFATTTSDSHTMEVNLKYQVQNGQYTSDCDHQGAVCGPHSNCPCSVHSKTTVSDDEDQPLTDFLINSNNSIDNIETQSLQNAESQDTNTENNKTNGDMSNNGESNKDTNGGNGVNNKYIYFDIGVNNKYINGDIGVNNKYINGNIGVNKYIYGGNGVSNKNTYVGNGVNNKDTNSDNGVNNKYINGHISVNNKDTNDDSTVNNRDTNSHDSLRNNNMDDGDNGVNNGDCSQILLDQRHCVKLYAEDKGPKLYPVNSSVVTEPIITKNLPEAFKFLPIFGMPKKSEELEQFQNAKVREYVGCDLSDEEFSKLASFCSPEHLKTGNELRMSTSYPRQEPLPEHIAKSLEISELGQNLCLVKKLKLRKDRDTKQLYTKKLIYRGVKVIPMAQNMDYKVSFSPLEPGKDLVFRVRVYRPFFSHGRDRHHTRHSIFTNDIVLLGRQKLTVLRDRLVCSNDEGMRVDMSLNPDDRPAASAKDIFPSGFLFINNAFYVDTRDGCKDHSEAIRKWSSARRLGDFPSYDMAQVTVDQLLVRLGHPEVYVHQGNCEHLFTFSEVRLLNSNDPLRQSVYPFHSAVAQHQTLYCTTCAEFGAKWIVIGCARVPFDPAFFCEICFKLYLYKDGEKVCDFKAYCYKGNLINLLKPV